MVFLICFYVESFFRSPFDTVLEAVGTAASVGVIKDRIFSGDAPRERISSWINSLTFIPKPDLDLMVASFPILRARDNYPGIMLSYSSLAHSFCRQHLDCSKHQPVQILSMLYEKFFNLTGCVTKQRKNVDQASLEQYDINLLNYGGIRDVDESSKFRHNLEYDVLLVFFPPRFARLQIIF